MLHQGSFFSSISKFSLSQENRICSTCQSKLPKNIFNFTNRYINNSLPTRKNLNKWEASASSECSFCLHPETLLHVVAGCGSCLNRFTWRHDSILNFIANNLPSQHFENIFVDLPGFSNPSIITGDKHRPDLLLTTKDNCLYTLELTVGYETNLRNNIERKRSKFAVLIKHFKTVKKYTKESYKHRYKINVLYFLLPRQGMVKSRFDDNLNHYSYILIYNHILIYLYITMFLNLFFNHVIQVDDCKLPF